MPKVRHSQFSSAWQRDEGGARGSSGHRSEVSGNVEPRPHSTPPLPLTRCHGQGMRVWQGMERARRWRRSGAGLIRGSAGGEGWREALEISGGGLVGGPGAEGGRGQRTAGASAAHTGPNMLTSFSCGRETRRLSQFGGSRETLFKAPLESVSIKPSDPSHQDAIPTPRLHALFFLPDGVQ